MGHFDPVCVVCISRGPTGFRADDYTLARGVKDNSRNQESHRKSPKGAAPVSKRCHTCGRPGHLARDCRQGSATARTEAGNTEMTSRGDKGVMSSVAYKCPRRIRGVLRYLGNSKYM